MSQPDAPPPPPPRLSPPGDQRLPEVVKVLSEVASLVALATALLYYFGWRRSETQARAFGADASVFAMSTQDFVLRSLDVLLLPLIAVLLLSLLGVALHRRLLRGGNAGRAGALLRWSWLLPLVVGVPLLVLDEPAGQLAFPLWVTLGLLGTWYAASLRRRAADRATGRVEGSSLGVLLLAGSLTALCLFWVTERVAVVGGQARADDIKASVSRALQGVTVFSARRLHLAGTGVTERDLGDPEAAYRYRYDGLYLLQQSGGKYFLLTGDWGAGQGRLVPLPDDGSVRLEFGPGR